MSPPPAAHAQRPRRRARRFQRFQPAQGLGQLVERYGRIELAGGRVTTPGWEDAHMISADADWLPRGHIYVSKLVWPALQSAFEACLDLHEGYAIRTLG